MKSTSARPSGAPRRGSLRRLALVPAVVALLSATACSSADPSGDASADSSTGPAEPPTAVPTGEESATPSSTPESAGTVAAPLELSGVGTTEVCAGKRFPRDLAFFDVSWEAVTDLEFFEIRVDAHEIGRAHV